MPRRLAGILGPLLVAGVVGSGVLDLLVRLDVAGWLGPWCWDAALVQASALHRQVWNLQMRGIPLIDAGFSDAERQHLTEVAGLWRTNRWLLAGMLIALALTVRLWPGEFRAWAGTGGRLLLGGLCALGLIAIPWPLFFRAWHPLLFAGGGWDFAPGVMMLRLYPETLWVGVGVIGLGLLVVMALGLSCWGRRAGTITWNPGRRWYGWLVLLLAAPAAWWAGSHLFVQWSLAYGIYYAICALNLGTVTWLMTGRQCGRAGVAVCAGLVLHAVLVSSLWRTCSACLDAVLAGQAWLASGSGDQTRLPHLPPPAVWYHESGPDWSNLGFQGPLQFHYQWTSWTATWNVLAFGPADKLLRIQNLRTKDRTVPQPRPDQHLEDGIGQKGDRHSDQQSAEQP